MQQRPGMFETTAEGLAFLARMTLASIIALIAVYGIGQAVWDLATMSPGAVLDLPPIPARSAP